MSPLSPALRLATLLFFTSFTAAQVYAPDCSLTWEWSFNSLGQNACTIAAYLMATCYGGTFTVNPLLPGHYYGGPAGIDDSDLCKCNTVSYSLISACDACQGSAWITWSEYSFNCTKTMPPSSFPNAIPSGTRVPKWALIDITTANNWNSNQSFSVGDTPEQAPGAILGGSSGISTTLSASSTRTSSLFSASSSTVNPTSSSSSKGSSNMGAIIGGAVGGVAVILLGVFAIIFLRQRRSGTSDSRAIAAPPFVGASQPPMDEIQQPLATENGYSASSIPGTTGSSSMPGTPVASMRIYDPNDPSTYPGYQGGQVPESPSTPHQGPMPSFSGTGNSLATMQTSRPQGYHGLPTV